MKRALASKRFVGIAAIAVLILVLAAIAGGCSGRSAAATVNGESIPLAEVDAQLQQLERQHGGSFQGADAEKMRRQFREQILNALIDLRLILQEAKRQGISVSDAEVDRRVEEAKKTAQIGSQKELEAALQQQGLTIETFKEQVKESMIRLKLTERVTKDVKVTEAEVEQYYKTNLVTYKDPEQVKARQILVKDEALAKKILGQLKQGSSFETLAKKHSIDTQSKDKGGEMPWLVKNQVDPVFANAVFALAPGQLSGVIKTTNGFHVVRVEQKKPARQKTLKEAREEIRRQLLEQRKRQKYQQWLDRVKSKAKIEKYIT